MATFNKHPTRNKAKKLLNFDERDRGVTPFDSKAWTKRNKARNRKELLKFKGTSRTK